MLIFTSLISILITWWSIYELFYSPRARIKKLWEEVFSIASKIHDINKKYPEGSLFVIRAYEKEREKRDTMINTLLDYYFDPEEDREYVEENRATQN